MNANRLVCVSTPMKQATPAVSSQFQEGFSLLSPVRSRPETLPPLPKTSSADALWSPGSSSSSDDNNSPTALNRFVWDKPALVKKVDVDWKGTQSKGHSEEQTPSRGYVNDGQESDEQAPNKSETSEPLVTPSSPKKQTCIRRKSLTPQDDEKTAPDPSVDGETADSSVEDNLVPLLDIVVSKDPHSECRDHGETTVAPPPVPPQRNDSLQSRQMEEKELRNAAWFQAGIPREIALEVLAEEPIGSFIVRESTTKPGCYALSLRVPRDSHPTGIAHYLIMNTNRGYKIKGFTKEFSTLNALITHHSVMPELLPCPLSLSRYSRNLRTSGSSESILDVDRNRSLLSDLQRLMADLDL